MRSSTLRSVLLVALAGCGGPSPSAVQPSRVPATTPTDAMIAALAPRALAASDQTTQIDQQLASYFERTATRRGYIMTDKPLYQPGETIWWRADLRATGSLIGGGPSPAVGLTMQLVSPRGAIVMQKRAALQVAVAQNDFALPADLAGGEYTLTMLADDGTTDARKIIVNTYEAPRLKKTVELLRKAYGEGDAVTAAIEVARATGEPFADKPLVGVVTVDDVEIARVPLRTDPEGKAVARFALPAHIGRGDGTLTLLVEDGGVTESMQKRIPIVMKTIGFQMFPEGGDLIEGVPGRVYFAAKSLLGKPADVEGRIVDDRGQVVGELASIHDGMGRFELEPSADRSYHVEITKPAGITAKFDVPAAQAGGCALRAVGDDGPALRVAAICTTARTLEVIAALRETRVAGGEIEVAAHTPTLLELPIPASAQGAVRVTLLSSKREPLAERLVYHGRGQDLRVALTADKKTYAPRDPVKLHVHATDAAGRPVQASLGVAVVDDTVLAFADDKSARIRAHLFLEPELGATAPGAEPVDEPNFYFGDKPEAPAALDALLATRGYRRFAWQPVFAPPPPPAPPGVAYAIGAGAAEPMPAPPPMAPPMTPPMAVPAAAPVMPARHAGPRKPEPVARAGEDKKVAGKNDVAKDAFRAGARAHVAMAKAERMRDEDDGGDGIPDGRFDQRGPGFAPVRVFPVPEYPKAYDGPRTDFRETIYWNASVQTNADGNADVAFVANDSITSFRATAEGVSAGGLVGGGDAVIQAKMPVSIEAHLPTEVTAGDEVRLPVTLTNETDRDQDARLDAHFGAAFALAQAMPDHVHLHAGEKQTVFYPLRVVATGGDADLDVALQALGLRDEIHKSIRVVPLGFPFAVSASGTVSSKAAARQELDLAGALPGSMSAKITLYPSPLAAMTEGMAAMIREPGGCFEQTSSSNYPNIMIMSYLGANDAANAALVAKTQTTLDHGYKLLTGYETPAKGYEWFGKSPGHEALTAYGLMEFADMSKVYDVDPKMVERTASWLMTRRDHKGGFERSHEALDSFGRAGQDVTDAYIMWALAEAHRTAGMEPELAVQRTLGETTRDPYLLALATNTALLVGGPVSGPGGSHDMVARLAAMQAADGGFAGAHESITMSGGTSLAIETTALATLALIKASPQNEYEAQIRAAAAYLNHERSGGGWGNTQATILGLKALTAYAEHARQMATAGRATLVVNGKVAGTIAFDKGRKEALVWDDLAPLLGPGKNVIELRLEGEATLPYSIAIDYRSARPQSSDHAKVAIDTRLDKPAVHMGDAVVLHAHVENKTAGGVPMTLARVGIPGGLVFQTWQLQELRDQGLIDFYETGPREVVLYWRALAPAAKKDVDLHLLAAVPGTYEAPASSAYLYYTAEDKAWAAPVKASIAE